MRGHGKCAAGDEIRRRVLLDQQCGQADQNDQYSGRQTHYMVYLSLLITELTYD